MKSKTDKKVLKSIIKTFLILKGKEVRIGEIADFVNSYNFGMGRYRGLTTSELSRLLIPRADDNILSGLNRRVDGTTYYYSYEKGMI